MPAAKSGNHIYVTGTGNTLQSIATDIADPTFCSWDAPSATLTIWGGVARYLRIRNGGTLTIGDPNDYSVNETLAFSNNVANQVRFYVDTGGTLLQYGDTMIDFFTGTQRIYYVYLYGKITVLGNDTYKPVWQNYQRIYFYEQQTTDAYTNDIWHFEKMIIGSASAANYYALYFNSLGRVRNHIFRDIIFDKTYGKGFQMYSISMSYPYHPIQNITFENLQFNNVGSYPNLFQGARPKITGSTFGITTSYKVYLRGTSGMDNPVTHYNGSYGGTELVGQYFAFYDGNTFENNGYANSVLVTHSAVGLFRDNTFQKTSGSSFVVQYNGRVMLWTGNTFVYESFSVSSSGYIQWVFDLTLTIKDKHGNLLENATVYIEQCEGKESFMFKTNSNGKLINDHSLELALLTWKHQYGSNKTTNMELWSDASNGTSHKVIVFKEGYIPVSRNYVMSEAIADDIYLREVNNHKIEM